MNKWYCILLRQMQLQQGQSITSRMLMLYPLCNYVLFTGTTAFTATQYCFKQHEQLRHQICLQTISHKLDSENQILYFSIYARWSCFAVGWSYWFYLFIFCLLKHRGFLSFKNGFLSSFRAQLFESRCFLVHWGRKNCVYLWPGFMQSKLNGTTMFRVLKLNLWRHELVTFFYCFPKREKT